jgi:hypothetical protein
VEVLNSSTINPEVGFFIVGCLFTLVLGLLGFVFNRKNSPHEREEGKAAIFMDKNCGGKLGHGGTLVFTSPFIRVSVYEDFVVISTIFKIVLDISEIEKIEKARWNYSSLKLFHSNKEYASPLTIASGNLRELMEVIEAQMEKYGTIDETHGGEESE